MRVIFIGEYDLSDNLSDRSEDYGTSDPIECSKVDMEIASFDPWSFLEFVDTIRVAGIEAVNDGNLQGRNGFLRGC